jgi:hypothetical protein
MSRRCVNKSNVFWYICGQFTFKPQKRTITPAIKVYELYFVCKISDRTKIGLFIFVVQHVLCISGPGLTEKSMQCNLLHPRFGGN